MLFLYILKGKSFILFSLCIFKRFIY